MPLRFFIRTSKILMRLGVLFLKVFSFKMLLSCSYFFMKNACLITAKINLDINNYLQFLYAVQELGNSLHVRRMFCCLIDVVCKCQVMLL